MRKRFSLEDKRRLLQLYDQLPKLTLREAARRLDIAPSMLWNILHKRGMIIRGEVLSRKPRVSCGKSPRLEAALWRWVDQARQSGAPLSDLMIHKQAVALAGRMGMSSFRPSPRWYSDFKRREALVRERYRIHPEPNLKLDPEQGNTQPASDCPLESASVSSADPEADAEEPEAAARMVGVLEILGQPEFSRMPPTVISSSSSRGDMQTITVPSVQQMRDAMKTLATGLLYRGFSNFTLLHQFEQEVTKILKRSVAQGSEDSFVA